MRVAYFDCFSGISGDMTLGALIGAGADITQLRNQLSSLGLPITLQVETVRKNGFAATQVRFDAPPEHAHRHLSHILEILQQSALTAGQRDTAERIFQKLAEAEAEAHGSSIEKVHFHEVGALDSIADIAGAAVALELLGIEKIVASPVPTGSGSVRGAHGVMPIPAPGTAALLRGIPILGTDIEAELTTPTGAAILAALAESFGPIPEMNLQSIGYGAGTKDLKQQANLLRVLVGETSSSGDCDQVSLLETNLDDVPGEWIGHCAGELIKAGALDVYTIPIAMKKNRPGSLLAVLCQTSDRAQLEQIIFRETSTLGIRHRLVERRKLERTEHQVTTSFGTVAGKKCCIKPGVVFFSPEYESCAELARQHRVSVREVYLAATSTFQSETIG